MTWLQLMYDLAFFNAAVDCHYFPIKFAANAMQAIGGVGSCLISNWIAYVVLYVVWHKKSIDIGETFPYMLGSSLFVAFTVLIVLSIGSLPENAHPFLVKIALAYMYYNIRLVSIVLNFVMFGMTAYCNYLIRSKGADKTPAEMAINTLCTRLMYYPLVQVY